MENVISSKAEQRAKVVHHLVLSSQEVLNLRIASLALLDGLLADLSPVTPERTLYIETLQSILNVYTEDKVAELERFILAEQSWVNT